MADIADIAALVEPEARALGFDLVRVRLSGGDEPTLQVMAERAETGQLTIDDCAALSHRLSDLFDAMEADGRDPMEGAYRLEVSSPGIDRPLTRIKDFADWAGHDAKVVLSSGVIAEEGGAARKNLSGPIIGVDMLGTGAAMVRLNDRKSGDIAFPFADVADARLVLTDRLIAATAPLSVAGADEFEPDEIDPEHPDISEAED